MRTARFDMNPRIRMVQSLEPMALRGTQVRLHSNICTCVISKALQHGLGGNHDKNAGKKHIYSSSGAYAYRGTHPEEYQRTGNVRVVEVYYLDEIQ